MISQVDKQNRQERQSEYLDDCITLMYQTKRIWLRKNDKG
jgi:hypothetical protein